MRFTFVALALLPLALAAPSPAPIPAPAPAPAPAAPGNSTITPLVDTVVKWYPDVSCAQPELGRIRPDCGGQCHSVPGGFGSFRTNGNGVYGVNCHAYADSNCGPSTYLGQTGNHVSTSQSCYPFANAHSYICYYKC